MEFKKVKQKPKVKNKPLTQKEINKIRNANLKER